MALKDVQFFGAADRKDKDPHGKISSEYPGWYYPTKIDEFKEEIERDKRSIERGWVEPENKPRMLEDIAKREKVLEAILESQPKMTGKDKDEAAKAWEILGEKISEAMPTYYEMAKGLANPHREAKMMKDRCIDIAGLVQVARQCGVNIPNNETRVSRDQATKAWKILGRALGEETNVEVLRRNRKGGSYAADVPMEELMRG